MGTAVSLNACAGAGAIPDSLKGCDSTVNVENAQTIGDLSNAIVQGDADLRICAAKNEAIVAIAEANRTRWRLW